MRVHSFCLRIRFERKFPFRLSLSLAKINMVRVKIVTLNMRLYPANDFKIISWEEKEKCRSSVVTQFKCYCMQRSWPRSRYERNFLTAYTLSFIINHENST